MCGCDRATLSRHFGYQVEDSGMLERYARAGQPAPVYTPTNPLSFRQENGFNGYGYGLDARQILGVYYQRGYSGILPVKQQPKIAAPEPYTVPVVW